MNLKNISTDELETRAVKLVQTERKIIHLVLNHLLELEDRRVYAKYEYDGMYTYLIKKLGYSGPAASLRLKALRLLRATPMVAQQVESGSICLSQMAQVQSAVAQAKAAGKMISSEATLKVLEQIENKNTFETKSILAKEFDLPLIVEEVIKPQKDDSVRLETLLTFEQFKELEQSKSLLSHVCHSGNWADVIFNLARDFNRRKLVGSRSKSWSPKQAYVQTRAEEQTDQTGTDKVNANEINPKDKRSAKTLTQMVSASEVNVVSESTIGPKAVAVDSRKPRSRKYISVHTKRILLQKSQGCCEHQDPRTGKRCSSRYQLQVDHIYPWALGGNDDITNLRILCRSHNILRRGN